MNTTDNTTDNTTNTTDNTPGVYALLDTEYADTTTITPDPDWIREFYQANNPQANVSHLIHHLRVVQAAPEHGMIYINEFERGLTPHLIRGAVWALRQQAEKKDLTVYLCTRSSIVINCFLEQLDHILTPEGQPITSLHNEEWLAQEKPGTLYERGILYHPTFTNP